MSAASPPAPRTGLDWAVILPVAGLTVISLTLSVISGGNIGVVLGALLGVGALALIWFIPLRWTLLALIFLTATLEAPYEAFAGYAFRTPLEPLGKLLLGSLNLTTNIPAMTFSGFDLLCVYLFVVLAVRRARGQVLDTRANIPTARAMIDGAWISLGSLAAIWAHGLATGGNFPASIWQVKSLVLAVVLFFFLSSALRGPIDLPALGTVLISAAVYRALLATWIHFNILQEGQRLACSTTHADSLLFAAALVFLITQANERVPRAWHWSRLLCAVTILAGMIYNGRRLVWVSTGMSLVIVMLISPWTPLKRRLARSALLLAPVVALYIAVGWNNSGSAIFKPVATIRSITDSSSDGSTLWRDLENSNLVQNISDHPLLGVGFGKEYVEYIVLPSVTSAYPQFRLIPHNSVLGFVGFAGALGISGIFAMLVTVVFLSVRSYHLSPSPVIRTAGMMSVVLVFLFANQMYGDIGVSQWVTTLSLGAAMAVAGKIATSTGAWPWRPRSAEGRAWLKDSAASRFLDPAGGRAVR